jgi:glycosyltransferase involved in cell wall biosynthesis
MACGTPVIATAVGGIGEQIEDGVSGFLVARGDSTAMADRVGELLADPARARRMGAAAAAFAGRHGLEQQAGRYLAWFDQLREEYHQELHSDLRR